MRLVEQVGPKTVDILGVPIAAVDMKQAVALIEAWIEGNARTYVTVTGVHGIIESQDDAELLSIHRAAGMCTPDGMPGVWIGRLAGHSGMARVYGPDLMLEVMKTSVAKGYRHFFYGGKDGVAEVLADRLCAKFPGLNVVGIYSPPFRPLTSAEEAELAALVECVAPDIFWVGLSTPKQEKWMAAHVGRLNTKVMVGVGAAFDFHAGLVKQAPRWVQPLCLEWLYRLTQEPRRLWRRYLRNNPRFVYLMLPNILRITGRRLWHKRV